MGNKKVIDKINKEIEDSRPAMEKEFNIKISLLKSIQKDLSIRVIELESQVSNMGIMVDKIQGRMGL